MKLSSASLMLLVAPALGRDECLPTGMSRVDLPNGRWFNVYVPTGLSGGALPMIVDWHGFTESPWYQDELTQFSKNAQGRQWLMTYPAGTASTPEHSATCCDPSWSEDFCQSGGGLNQVDPCAHNAGSCCGGAGTDDVQFARDINNFMESACFGPSTASLNTESVFSTGFSNGGMMTNRLGCEAADLYAGIAPQAGNIMTQRFGDFQACNPSRPISYLGFCGTNDGVCIGTFNRTTAEWAGHNNCAGETTTTVSTATTTCTRTTNCDGGVIVEQCLIDGLGHEWSGHPRPDGTSSQRPNTDIDSTVYIFDVFSTLL